MNKTYLSSQLLLDKSYQLAIKVFESGFRPDFIIGVWRGGAPVGIAVQEAMDFLGVESDHIAIRTSSYTGIGKRDKQVRVHGLRYLEKQVNAEDSVLIVDDVFDTGLSIDQVIKDIARHCRKNTPEIRVAAPYFKPANNRTDITPDYYVEESDEWLVFPHELDGLTDQEIIDFKQIDEATKSQLLSLKS
ncbi:MAG: hypoxanthine phosphoribosyltransferase [Pseudomonadales bacterium]|nr:hypoxanthine phosphoribosyltransferase [Pseudomonadales bacterium]